MTSRPWLFAEDPGVPGAHVALSREESHHARAALRLRPGDEVCVTDGRGTVASGTLSEVGASGAAVVVTEVRRHERPVPELVVYQAAAKGTKIDDLLDRLAQLGVSETRVFCARRSVVRWDRHKSEALARRWTGRARAAAKQSRSPWCMATGSPLAWAELVASVSEEPNPLLLWHEAGRRLRAALRPADRVALVVGPEGGLEQGEIDQLRSAGAVAVSLGPRVLRTENAAVVAASAILFSVGAIG